MYRTLKELLPVTPSVSGLEGPIREILTREMTPLCDKVYTDAMGNLICEKKGTGKNPRRVLLNAHMDEIGFLVTFIEENGLVRIAPIGGIDYTAAVGSEVVFGNGTGGVLAAEAGTDRDKAPRADKCFVDIGASDQKAAGRRVKIGDACALRPHLYRLSGNRVAGRPLDDRVGCAILLAVARELPAPADDLILVFSVQEEVGCRGAGTAAYRTEPDVSFTFDVTGTGDLPGATPMAVKLGGGAAVKIKDRSVICDAALVSELLALGKEKKIPVQSEILPYGGTDTSAIQAARLGCRAGAISIPCRYIHSGNEVLDLTDVRAAADLVLAYLGGK